MQTSSETRSLIPLAGIATIKLCFHLATANGYGLVRDEFYYLASTDHLAWGYVEHPPLSIALLALSRALLGDSLLAIRFLPALAGAATVFITGLIARAMGGSRRAELLAAIAALSMPTYLAMGHFFSMNVFDVFFWALLAWIAVRALAGDHAKTWLVFGLVAGVGLMNKISVGFLGLGLALGLVLTSARSHLMRPYLWLGALIALLIFLPHLVWQLEFDWPTLEFQANARAAKNVAHSPLGFAGEQVLLAGPVALPLWLTGLGGLLFGSRFQKLRPLGVIYPALFILFIATAGKTYYLTPIYTLLFAAGAVLLDPMMERRRQLATIFSSAILLGGVALVPMTVPVLSLDNFLAYPRAIGIAPPVMERHEQAALPQNFADMFGWDELVDAVEQAAASLSPEERARAVVLAQNYGEAGSVEFLGAGRELPPVVCGHNSYWDWRPETIEGPMIALGSTREELEVWFEHVEHVDTIRCKWCMPYQNNSPVHIARGLRVPIEEFWSSIRVYR